MYKKTLQIQTNFLEEQDTHAAGVTTSKINYQQKLQAGILLQKSLSMILARNFIECWKQLKSNEVANLRYRKNNRVGFSKSNLNVQQYQQQRFNGMQSQNNIRVPKARSQSHMQRYLKTSQSEDVYEQYRVKRNRSVRVINQQIQYSRAAVLKQIVEKLKNCRKTQDEEQQDNINHEVLKKITHLERLVKGIRNQSRNQLTVIKTIDEPYTYRQNAEPSIQDEQLVRQFMDEVYQIRKQINQIKINNQAILRAELQRSQVSEASSKNRANSLKEQVVYKKQYVSEGVQTQIHTKNRSQVTEMQPTLSEIEEKHKKLSQQPQTNSKLTRLTQVNGGSSSNLGLGNLFPLGSSNTQTNQTDKFNLNSFNKYSGSNLFTQKASPPQSNDFGSLNNGMQFKPPPNISSNYIGMATTSGQPSFLTTPMPPKPALLQPQSYQIPTSMGFNASQPPINLPPRPNSSQFNIPPPLNYMKPAVSFEYPKYDHIKSNNSIQSKNYIISDLGSTNSLMGRVQQPDIRHYRQPSFFVQQDVRRNITYSNYCSACGRNCGCPRVFNETRRF